MEYYLTLKRKEILTHAETKMNFGAMLREVSQTDVISCTKHECTVAVGLTECSGDRRWQRLHRVFISVVAVTLTHERAT